MASFDTVLKSIGKSKVKLNDSDVLIKVLVGEVPEYQNEITELDENQERNDEGNIVNISRYLMEINKIMRKYAIRFIMNANPTYKEDNLNLYFETNADAITDVLDAAGIIDKKAMKERNKKLEESEEVKN